MPSSKTMPGSKNMTQIFIIAATLLLLQACGPAFILTGTVADGVIEGTHETFIGTASIDWPARPALQILTNTGARCVGDIRSVSEREAQGHLHCSDGRRGAFAIVSTLRSGASGFGDLGGKRIGFVVK
jgi:hypothetical protein